MELAEKHAFDCMNHQGILKVYLRSSGRMLICPVGTRLWRSFTIISVERLLLADKTESVSPIRRLKTNLQTVNSIKFFLIISMLFQPLRSRELGEFS